MAHIRLDGRPLTCYPVGELFSGALLWLLIRTYVCFARKNLKPPFQGVAGLELLLLGEGDLGVVVADALLQHVGDDVLRALLGVESSGNGVEPHADFERDSVVFEHGNTPCE